MTSTDGVVLLSAKASAMPGRVPSVVATAVLSSRIVVGFLLPAPCGSLIDLYCAEWTSSLDGFDGVWTVVQLSIACNVAHNVVGTFWAIHSLDEAVVLWQQPSQ